MKNFEINSNKIEEIRNKSKKSGENQKNPKKSEGAGEYSVLLDRCSAIELALVGADSADTVILAGKGHEDYQIIGREKLPFDDRVEARRALGARRPT